MRRNTGLCMSAKWTSLFFQGFNPMWNENFQFEVCVPDLALVRFLIEDYDSTSGNEFIGQNTLPFNSLRNGECSNHFLYESGSQLHNFSALKELNDLFYHRIPPCATAQQEWRPAFPGWAFCSHHGC